MTFFRIHGRVMQAVGTESRTKQAHKDECDINNILSQYKRTGMISHIAKSQARFDDLPDEIDYQASLNLIRTAEQAFADLPSTVRNRFGNDPAQLLQAIADPKHTDELVSLGILKPPRPVDVPPSNPPEPPAQ